MSRTARGVSKTHRALFFLQHLREPRALLHSERSSRPTFPRLFSVLALIALVQRILPGQENNDILALSRWGGIGCAPVQILACLHGFTGFSCQLWLDNEGLS